jgi:hypothetical protein
MIFHKHRILPGHMGGTYAPENVVRVNVAMHAFLHKCLWKQYGRWQDKLAFDALSGHIGKTEINAIKMREGGRKSGLASKGHYQPPCSDETRAKLRAKRAGRKPTQGMTFSSEVRNKMSVASKGRPKSEIHKRNIAASRLGKHLVDGRMVSCQV